MTIVACVVAAFTLYGALDAILSNNQLYKATGATDLRMEPLRGRLSGMSITTCSAVCAQTTNCVSFSHHAADQLCELNRYLPIDKLATTHGDTGWEIFSTYEICWPSSGYDGFVRDGMCYFWVSGAPPIPYTDSQAGCRANDAELVCIESEAENQALIDHVPSFLWWFGLNDLDGDGVFTCNAAEPVFTKWSPTGDLAPCVAVFEGTTAWHKELMSNAPPIRYADSQAGCRANDAELVCIESEAENQALIDHVPSFLWWFGLNDLDGDGVFTCNAAEPVFTKWSPTGDLEPCVAVFEGTTTWHKGACFSNISYVCEKRLYVIE